jgi:hypothetical protein
MRNDDSKVLVRGRRPDSDDSDIAFASVDFSGVNFDGAEKDGQDPVISDVKLNDRRRSLGWDRANVLERF